VAALSTKVTENADAKSMCQLTQKDETICIEADKARPLRLGQNVERKHLNKMLEQSIVHALGTSFSHNINESVCHGDLGIQHAHWDMDSICIFENQTIYWHVLSEA